jgi:hypothetical protein
MKYLYMSTWVDRNGPGGNRHYVIEKSLIVNIRAGLSPDRALPVSIDNHDYRRGF